MLDGSIPSSNKGLITEEIEDRWTNITIDSQIFSTFISCHRKADYVFNRHLVPVIGVAKAFNKGQVAHVGLHAYWKSRIENKSYQESTLNALEAAKKSALLYPNLDAEAGLDVFETLINFLKFIQNLSWTPVFVEQHFKFIAYEEPEIKLRIILTGRIDLGFRTPDGRLIPVDNKTEGERWFYSAMSNQFKIYCLACKSNVLGVQRMGFQKTLKPEDKFKLELITFDADVLEEWRTQTLPYWCKQLMMCKENDFWPMNTSSCIHGHFACQFSDKYNGGICNVSREVREQELMRYFTVGEPWNPENF